LWFIHGYTKYHAGFELNFAFGLMQKAYHVQAGSDKRKRFFCRNFVAADLM
jgi:hypothetical protein